MNLFTYLLLGHLVGDYLLQSSWMAMNKADKLFPLLTHCSIYTFSVSTAVIIGGFPLPIIAVVIIFISHVWLDKRIFVVWWTKKIMGVKQPEGNWLLIMTDQTFHLLVLGFVAHFFYR
ncbi:DUF3307 domain-containing protein [Sporosarcina obsidiansis]|uniref:DUF3307 domain-containing protein n=1 Tax=Sporosarcina obsidiansis TaxID=2660748 RepID=UPI00129B4DAF|nr:DUF3307 domain-containing protein [Sporosarcina obsidiansis]